MKNIKEEIVEIIMNVCDKNISTDMIYDNTNLIDDLGYDSLALMKLIVEIEDHFHISFNETDEILEHMSYFSNIVAYVEKKTMGV